MWVFNRIVMIAVFAALFVAGLFAVVYSFDLLGYQLSSLSGPVERAAGGVQGFIGGIEGGSPSPALIAILIAVAVAGLILLVLELKPRTPRRVRMRDNTFVTRSVVQDEVSAAAGGVRNVLGSSAKVKAARRPGAKVKLQADVRQGEDAKSVGSDLDSSVKQRLERAGIPLKSLKTSLSESDPRQTRSRVQ